MRLAITVLLSTVCAMFAQQPAPGISVTLSLLDQAATRDLLDRGFAHRYSVWVVTLENDSTEPVSISPAAVYRRASQLGLIGCGDDYHHRRGARTAQRVDDGQQRR